MVTRTVKVENDIRYVINEYGEGGESWRKWVIIPRQLMLETYRELKKKGYKSYQLSPKHLLLYLIPDYFQYVHCGGPGRPFANDICQLRCSRRFFVFQQHGGWDI